MKKFAVVTGGAQGIGAAAAKVLLSDGLDGVLLVDRNTEGLASKATELRTLGRTETFTVDLRDNDAAVARIQNCKGKVWPSGHPCQRGRKHRTVRHRRHND